MRYMGSDSFFDCLNFPLDPSNMTASTTNVNLYPEQVEVVFDLYDCAFAIAHDEPGDEVA